MGLQCYVDESCDGFGNRVAVMAGYLADEETWSSFNKDWLEVLSKQNKNYFHSSAKMYSRTRTNKDAEALYRVIEKHLNHAFCVIVDIAAYRAVIKNFNFPNTFSDERDLKLLNDPLCLMYQTFFELSIHEQYKLGVEGPVQFIFDKTTKYQDIVSLSFNYMLHSAPQLGIPMDKFGSPPYFDDDANTPALQAADLLSRLIRTTTEKGIEWTGSQMPWEKEKSIPCLIADAGEEYFLHRLNSSFSRENTEIYYQYKRQQNSLHRGSI